MRYVWRISAAEIMENRAFCQKPMTESQVVSWLHKPSTSHDFYQTFPSRDIELFSIVFFSRNSLFWHFIYIDHVVTESYNDNAQVGKRGD